MQVPLYKYTILPASYVIKKIKGNPQNKREMFIDILDWFTPQYRWEHTEEQVKSWYSEEGFSDIKITTRNIFGFNSTGIKE